MDTNCFIAFNIITRDFLNTSNCLTELYTCVLFFVKLPTNAYNYMDKSNTLKYNLDKNY